jgi:tetratricopeptide (TPR) repeat protein
MNCEQVLKGDIAGKYILRQLSVAEQEAFEEHYFECERCFEMLQTCRVLQVALNETSSVMHTEPIEEPVRWRWTWGLAALLLYGAALIFVAAVAGGFWKYRASISGSSHHAPVGARNTNAAPKNAAGENKEAVLAQLARVDPPPYNPTLVRGAEDQAALRFRRAMSYFLRKDYVAAIPGLQDAARLDANSSKANFYLGACYLLTDQTDSAIKSLQKAASSDAADYAEQAHFYLAKAYLRNNDVRSAQNELELTVKFHGDRENEAKDLEQELHHLPRPAEEP